jgi:molybdopterin converting factor subunit 1
MSIRILFFATLAEATGLRETKVEASTGPDVASIYACLSLRFPKLKAHRTTLLCAVNSEFARPDSPVHDGDEVAFFPHVSGG